MPSYEQHAANRHSPPADACVVRNLLDKWCELKPEQAFAVFHGGPQWSFADMRQQARSAAAALARLGVKQGDTVVVWLPNSPDMLRIWFGINWLGATYVPINTAYKGKLLEHVLQNSGANLLITNQYLALRLDGARLAGITQIVVLDDNPGGIARATVHPASALQASTEDPPPLERHIEPWDIQSIIYTSGTTGPSKGVLSSYAHLFAMSGPQSFNMVESNDRYMCNLPLFHVGGTIPVMGMLARGGSVSFVGEFSTDTFWSSINETQTTIVLLLGAMATFIAKSAPGAHDRNHTLKKVIIVPLAENAQAFADRFGVDVYSLYNMTEISTPLVTGRNPAKVGVAGRPRPGVDIRIVDGNDQEVARGETGELIVRTDSPFALNSGYFQNAEATVIAWRNGWFHTGDAFRVDDDGDYVFVDRMKDTIRRRGENISSFEVEAEVAAHPDVSECAVVPVPSELGEDDMLCVVVAVAGRTIDETELLEFLKPRLAYFMLPRYVRIVGELPKTPTAKIQKHLLRSSGVTADTWDREMAGIKVSRDRIGV